MYGHVQALRLNAFRFSVDGAILNFMKKHGISEDELPLEAARQAFYRMDREYNEHLKGNG